MRRVVITGIGAVSPCGNDVATTWDNIAAGRSGIGPITRFDASDYASRIAGEVTDFRAEQWVEKRKLKEGDTFIHYSIAAARMAVETSGFSPSEEQKNRVGTIVGVGLGGLTLIEKMSETLLERGPKRISPYFIPASLANLAPGQISMLYGFRGTSYTTTSACASGAHAIGEAFRAIRHGYIDACVAGGAESTITGLAVGGFAQMRALSTRNDEPARASRPYDRARDGFVIAEGAGMCLLEEREAAIARGARIIAEVVGYGSTADAYHLTQPAEEGEGAQRAMREALLDARLSPDQVGYVNTHGTSTEKGDINELVAIRQVFGAHALGPLSISSTKSMTGHLLGAAGALEAVLCCLALERGVLPPTINLEDPVDAAKGMDLVPNEARERRIDYAMSNSFGFGGTNATLILKRGA